ncbi:MAG: hypothetical protein DRG58_02445 [Deltaproteobacteria bacterium]|nr:MAG: hypothetical protein DRG58_02445 [Deltaproteobacteria bacterium]
MALIQQLRGQRARRKSKAPFRISLFTRICFLVQTYALGASFIDQLDRPGTQLLEESWARDPVPAKAPWQPPLFALATPGEYQVTMAIITRINNPYLHFVQSPAEILLCQPLFELNPDLSPEVLATYHFAALWQRQLARPQNPSGTMGKAGGI